MRAQPPSNQAIAHTAMSDITLSALYKRALQSASKTIDLPTIEDETQELVQASLRDLNQVHKRIRDLSLFSPNESLEDIPTKDLIYLTLPYAIADVENRVRTTERSDRMAILAKSVGHFRVFSNQLEHYTVIPPAEKTLYSTNSATLLDPTKRRETKINQYKKMKEIKERVRVLQKRKNTKPSPSTSTSDDDTASQSDFSLIISVLPDTSGSSSGRAEEEEELDSETDEIQRETTILLLRLLYAQTQSHLESMEQELDLLRSAPPTPSSAPPPGFDERDGKRKESENDMWKLDALPTVFGKNGKGALIDHRGKPLRPFTILPSDAGERARLQQEVFGPGYNLPTMSIDEYLEIERGRGNIITGGGQASMEEPTSSEQLQIDSEMDGTAFAEQRAEEKRQKDEKWAQYKDANPRGAGNTMNRG